MRIKEKGYVVCDQKGNVIEINHFTVIGGNLFKLKKKVLAKYNKWWQKRPYEIRMKTV